MVFSIFADLVNRALDSPEELNSDSSVLSHILAAEGVDTRDKIVTLIDLVAAGIETVHFQRLKVLYLSTHVSFLDGQCDLISFV